MALYITREREFSLTLQDSEFLQRVFLAHLLGLSAESVTQAIIMAAENGLLTQFMTPKNEPAILVGAFPNLIQEIQEISPVSSWLKEVVFRSSEFKIISPSGYTIVYKHG